MPNPRKITGLRSGMIQLQKENEWNVDPIVKLGSQQRNMTNPGQNGCLLLAPLKNIIWDFRLAVACAATPTILRAQVFMVYEQRDSFLPVRGTPKVHERFCRSLIFFSMLV